MGSLTPVRIVAWQTVIQLALVAAVLGISHFLRGETPYLEVSIIAGVAVSLSVAAAALHAFLRRSEAEHRLAQQRLQESLELFDLTLSTLEECVLSLDPTTGVVIRANAAVQKVFGLSSEDIRGMDTRSLHPSEEEYTRFEQEMKRTTSSLGFFRVECSMKRKNGECFPAEMFVRPNRRRGGPFCVICVIRDLSDKKRRETEAARFQHLESLSLFAAGIAHDFNNMLAVVLAHSGLAKLTGQDTASILAHLTDVESAAQKARDLARQLQVYAKGGEAVRRPIPLAGMLRQYVDLSVRGTGTRADIGASSSLWTVEADEGQIGQVIHNLALNAVQAMPDGGRLEVWAENFIVEATRAIPLRAGQYVKITFRDEGPGIPRENLPRIFDPYFTTKPEGSGLGLATAHSIVGKHGGLLDVESWTGTGSLFTVFLPASGEKAHRDRSGEGIPPAGAGCLLIQDDEATVRRLTGEMVRNMGYDAVEARSGEEAVELFRRQTGTPRPFAGVLLGRSTPEDGIVQKTARSLLAIDPTVRILVTEKASPTALPPSSDPSLFHGAIVKPYTSSELSRALHRLLAKGQKAEARAVSWAERDLDRIETGPPVKHTTETLEPRP